MPDTRAVQALLKARATLRDTINMALHRAGYDPKQLAALPDPADCTCSLADLIRAWHELNARLDVAERRTGGWRY